ncbi:MAG: hypothetical protein IJB24_03455 [Clostridia bacterium]|nr:hypothetical protein [Clostridia bacterium]
MPIKFDGYLTKWILLILRKPDTLGGPSEEEALDVILNRIFDNETVYVHIMHCDITTQNRVTPQTILKKIGDEIRGYAVSNHFKKDNFKEIIHLVDTDGAYIPDANVIQDDSADILVHSENKNTDKN